METEPHRAAIRKAYADAAENGVCVIPVTEDGKKQPFGAWAKYQTEFPAPDLTDKWAATRSGIGVVAGHGVEGWDFDDRICYQTFCNLADQAGLAPTIERIEAGYSDRTPRDGGGIRWLVRYGDDVDRAPGSKLTLARRPRRPDEITEQAPHKVKVLIELPAFIVTAPSNGKVHPTGRPYQRLNGGFDTIAVYSAAERDALMGLAQSLDDMAFADMARTRKRTPAARPRRSFIASCIY